MKIENRKAYHDYFVEGELECGIALKGNEVKSIKNGSCSIKEAWCAIDKGNLVIKGMHVSKWDTSNQFDIEEVRDRQLLVHKFEIRKLESIIKEKGFTLIPLKIYCKNGKLKVLVGICKGKHAYDKRESLKKRQVERELERLQE